MENKNYPYGGQDPYANLGGLPHTGFAGGSGMQGMGAPPPAGFHAAYTMPPDDGRGPKPYSNESGSDSSYGDLKGVDFSEKSIRMAFIRKVYGILSVQLVATTALIALFCLHGEVKGWVRKNFAFTLVTYLIAIVLLIALTCCENLRRKSPHNLILLGAFTLTYGTVIGVIASTYKAESVVIAAAITVVISIGLTIFSFQTKYDFTMIGGALFVCTLCLFMFGLFAIFLGPSFQLVMAAGGAMLFSVYLVYDTQLMIGGEHKMSISPEEYIFAALNLYVDVIMIFLHLLRLLGSRD